MLCTAAILGCTSRLRLLGTGLANWSHALCIARPQVFVPFTRRHEYVKEFKQVRRQATTV